MVNKGALKEIEVRLRKLTKNCEAPREYRQENGYHREHLEGYGEEVVTGT